MKKTKLIYITIAATLIVGSCKQENLLLVPPTVVPPVVVVPSKGTADFTKFVSIGNSFVAGMQSNALFNTSQANSLAKILAKQFESVGGSTTFNQPDINSVNGFNPIQSRLDLGLVLGRLVLFDPDGPTGPRTPAPYPAKYPGAAAVTCPSPVSATPALKAPYNTADLPGAYAGDKAALNNFGVPLIYLGQTLTPFTGAPANPNPPAAPINPAYSPFYARFASSPGVSTIVGDAKTAAGSFYLIWLGFDDVLLYAATGAANDGQPTPPAGTYPMTSSAAFSGQFDALMNTLLTGTTFNGVVGNIPYFYSLPYFYTVPWNTITLDAGTATTLTTNLANNYNAFLDGMVTNLIITDVERTKRRLNFVAGKNGVLLSDDVGYATGGLTDLSPFMTGPYAGLLPYALARQATSTDLVPLAAGSVLGTCNGGAAAIWGVSFPLPDNLILTQPETGAIKARTDEYNTKISAVVAASGGRLALADVNKAYADLVTNKAFVGDGVMITPSFAPPTGAYSEDGLHPNNRGYAFTANVFIDAINAKFTAVIPKANLALYGITGLPVNP